MSTWAGRGVCWPIRSPTCWGRSPGTPHSFTSPEPNSAMLRERRRMFHTVFRFLNFGLQLGIIQGFSLHFLLLNVLVILALKTITEKRLKFNFRFWRSLFILFFKIAFLLPSICKFKVKHEEFIFFKFKLSVVWNLNAT